MNVDSFTVTLLSNSSHAEYPDNKIFSFTNILGQELILPIQEKWRVCIQSITLGTDFIKADYEAQRVKARQHRAELRLRLKNLLSLTTSSIDPDQIVNKGEVSRGLLLHLNQLLEAAAKKLKDAKLAKKIKANFVQVRSDIIAPKYEDDNVLTQFSVKSFDPSLSPAATYQPITNEYFDLTSNTINRIGIRLTAYDNTDHTTELAQPTVVVLKFKKMIHEDIEYFTLRAENEGKLNNFLVSFPDTLTKDGTLNPWEMALSKITFPPHFHKFPSKIGNAWLYPLKKAFKEWHTKRSDLDMKQLFLEGNKARKPISHPQGSDFTEENVLQSFTELLESLATENDWNKFTISYENKRLKIETTGEVVLVMPLKFTQCLGISEAAYILAGDVTIIPIYPNKPIRGAKAIDVNFLIPRNLLLYSDCVKPSLIGNVYGQFLTNIPIPIASIEEPLVTYEPVNLEFHPLQSNDLSNVRFKLLNTDGTEPHFENYNSKIFLTLLVRRKKYKQNKI